MGATGQVNLWCYFKSCDDNALCCGFTTVGFVIYKYSACNDSHIYCGVVLQCCGNNTVVFIEQPISRAVSLCFKLAEMEVRSK